MDFPFREPLEKEYLENVSDEESDVLLSTEPRFSIHRDSILPDTSILKLRQRHKNRSINTDGFILEEREEKCDSEDDSFNLKQLPIELLCGVPSTSDESEEASESLSLTSHRPKSVRFKVPECEEILEEFPPEQLCSNNLPTRLPLQKVKFKVKEITSVMKHNDSTSRLWERQARLNSKTGDIYFENSQSLRRKLKWRQLRIKLALCAVCFIGILLFLFPAIKRFVGKHPNLI